MLELETLAETEWYVSGLGVTFSPLSARPYCPQEGIHSPLPPELVPPTFQLVHCERVCGASPAWATLQPFFIELRRKSRQPQGEAEQLQVNVDFREPWTFIDLPLAQSPRKPTPLHRSALPVHIQVQ